MHIYTVKNGHACARRRTHVESAHATNRGQCLLRALCRCHHEKAAAAMSADYLNMSGDQCDGE